jgi:SAM-dependent methyltransferase
MATWNRQLAVSNAVQGEWEYTGRELESMAFAVNYHRWILQMLRPFLGERLVEVGAGTGSFSELLLETNPESLTMLEPSANMYPVLVRRLQAVDKRRVGRPLQSTLGDAANQIRERPNSILYVNVLEHIEDDEAELAAAYSLLAPGGRVLIFVPANPWLMSPMDRQMGHYRRYKRSELLRKCRSAGFDISFSANFDILGIVPWWLKYCLMRSKRMESGLVWLYDRGVLPIAKILEAVISPPIGKNVVVVGEKT